MKLNVAVLSFLVGHATAAIGSLCKANGITGTCQSNSWCDNNDGQRPVRGACPNDPSNVMCCIYPLCNNGICMSTSDSFCGQLDGGFVSNRCPGPTSYKCCVY
ncbi:hypothetical protein C8A01DRAFT_32628 [Parachaetomium inaequale]|uniref:Uncharacterized protein n=1 Tax=Parachaetomium inaequale TaxID=2588326 RepID=A0AAN6PLL4_9PEZI|nr:hypothetical protein C8A01DRAFT_32628 [Parachaetomium inaequale]